MALLARSLARWRSWWSEQLSGPSNQLMLTCTFVTSSIMIMS